MPAQQNFYNFAEALHHNLIKGIITDAEGEKKPLLDGLQLMQKTLLKAREKSQSIYLIGNGGSAGVASHIANDFIKTAHLRAVLLHDPAILTCLANDYGYDNAYAKALERLAVKDDLLIAISSSGRSKNIIHAAKTMKKAKGEVITLSGFKQDNTLRGMGALNFWINSDNYGIVEIAHLFLLHYLAECLKK
ncbi:SIS domain-containing protein [Magnetococcales bacterium HHB-1]